MMLTTTPALITAFYTSGSENALVKGVVNFMTSPSYIFLFAFFTVIFSSVFTIMQFNPTELANELRHNNGYIAGVKPGKPTAQFLNKLFANMNYAGAFYLLVICVVPMIIAACVAPIRGFWYAGIAFVFLSVVANEMLALIEMGIKENDEKKKNTKPTKTAKAFK